MIGETVGNYKIIAKVSIGGMGTVYKAEHTLIGKHAAVKILHPELCNNRDLVQRFFNEAKATTTIKHAGIVEIFDYGIMKSGNAYLTMEFLEGMSLARRLKTRGKMGEGEAAMLLRSVCSALGAAHAKGIVHRDLKPDNIFLSPDPDSAIGERPKILDFGIAKLTDIGLAGTTTRTGAVMGTPTYMSPEQCRGTGEVDARADLYSIGCIYYELVTGKPPFTNLGAGELIGAHLYVEPDPPTMLDPDLHEDTVKLIMALLRKKPAERPQSAKELGQRLTDIAQKLGWITAASPAGITGPVLTDLALRAQTSQTSFERPRKTPLDEIKETTPVFTPGGSPAPSLHSLSRQLDAQPSDEDIAAEKPTTLSGAASQVDYPKRSRKGLAFAMAAAALLAGGTVAFLKLNQTKPEPAAAKAPEQAKVEAPKPEVTPASKIATPMVDPQKVDPQKVDPQKVDPQRVDSQKVDPPVEPPPPPPPVAAKVEPAVEPAKIEKVAVKDDLAQERAKQRERRRAARKPEVKKLEPKPIETKPPPKPEPPKPPPPKTNPLIERDI